MHERRTIARANERDRLAHRPQAREKISAVDRVDVQTGKRADQLRDVAARCLELHRDGDGVAVVFHQEHHRQLAQTGPIQRFPEFAFAGRALPERRENDFVCVKMARPVVNLRHIGEDDARVAGADAVEHLSPGRARTRHDMERGVAQCDGIAVRQSWIAAAADAGERISNGGHCCRHSARAVAGKTVDGSQRNAGSHLDGFVPAPLIWKKILPDV